MKWWTRDYIFLPPRYLPDLKHAGKSKLSFFKNLSDVRFITVPFAEFLDDYLTGRIVGSFL